VNVTLQRADALAKANRVRSARLRIKRDVRAGRVAIGDVLDDPAVASMPVADLLAAQLRWGPCRAGRLLRRVPCSESLPVGQLTERQRGELLRLLPVVSTVDTPAPVGDGVAL
jgi:hypothetical protein